MSSVKVSIEDFVSVKMCECSAWQRHCPVLCWELIGDWCPLTSDICKPADLQLNQATGVCNPAYSCACSSDESKALMKWMA